MRHVKVAILCAVSTLDRPELAIARQDGGSSHCLCESTGRWLMMKADVRSAQDTISAPLLDCMCPIGLVPDSYRRSLHQVKVPGSCGHWCQGWAVSRLPCTVVLVILRGQ